ncbi:MAG: cadherin domain-containing protein [Verrucomicrobiae bacterium]|nr:cadherin domain-containing protein [Verrucomicrobiae bacterium]
MRAIRRRQLRPPGLWLVAVLLCCSSARGAVVKFEAESGVRGSEVGTGTLAGVTYIYPLVNNPTNIPVTTNRVVTYTVVFPEAGTYDLYARVRVGAAAWSDDSFLYGNGFGAKSPTNSTHWIVANNLWNIGYTNSDDVVSGAGTAGTNVWKWINLSELAGGIMFTVPVGQLTQTFQIGMREDGFWMDAFAFGTADYVFTVADLDAGRDGTPPGAPQPGQCVVNWTNLFQRIDGFGACSAWRSTWSTWQADMFFTSNTGTGYSRQGTPFTYRGVGLSLLRTRIAPGGGTVEQSIMQMAQARGARVWSTPWTPPTTFKTTNALGQISLNGGAFVGTTSNYQAYASQLAGYVANMKRTYGVDIYAISVQNEPDYNTTNWESCVWTDTQIRDFIPYLAAALAASNAGATKIMIPESMNWKVTPLYTTAMNDPNVAPLVSIIANHNYVMDNEAGDQTVPAAITNYGKALWQTEVSRGASDVGDIADGIYWAWRIHLFLTVAQVNAWHYWWLCAYGSSGGGLCDTNDVPAKRMYTLGNFSRFVRPGYHRIGATSSANLLASAYKDTNSGAFAIVVINTNASTPVSCAFVLTNLSGNVSTVTPWITSGTLSLADQPSVAVTNRTFTYVIPPLSVVTLVGQVAPTNSAPTDIQLSNAAVGENMPLGTPVGVFSTVDPDPGDTFTYSLVSGAGSADNSAFSITNNVLYTATSFDHETKPTASIRVRSTDQGGLWTEKVFSITITNVNEPPVDIALSNNAVPENRPAGTPVGSFSTTDPDAGGTFTYALVAGPGDDDNAAFVITNNVLYTAVPFDYEAKSTYSIRVRSTDQGGLYTEKVFTVAILNTNEPPTDLALSGAGVAENQPAGTLVGYFSTFDPDVGETFEYSLVGGTGSEDNSAFAIMSNALVAATVFDFESKRSCSIRVRSTDSGGLHIEKAFVIAVHDVNEPPVFAPVPDCVARAGVTLFITNVVSDPDLPPQGLTFSLLAAPENAVLDSATGVFSWRPRVGQADSTNLIVVVVSDDGAPRLSSTNRFYVIVEPLMPARFSSVGVSSNALRLVITGPSGLDYTVLTSTDLVGWQELVTTNFAVTPFELVLPMTSEPARYFRLKLGP